MFVKCPVVPIAGPLNEPSSMLHLGGPHESCSDQAQFVTVGMLYGLVLLGKSTGPLVFICSFPEYTGFRQVPLNTSGKPRCQEKSNELGSHLGNQGIL